MLVNDFDYVLPAAAIAQAAIEPRDASRVLVVDDLHEIRFRDIARLFEAGDVLVVNRTKVRAARLVGKRLPTGGKTELLLTRRMDADRWEALVRPASRVQSGTVIDCGEVTATVVASPVEGVATVALKADGDLEAAIARIGSIPLPPYFHGELVSGDRYQTIFAKRVGSAAAPTAALHFTDDVVASLAEAGVQIAEVELEVGLDTFRPMGEGSIDDHTIHTERVVVDSAAAAIVNAARGSGRRVIAVGTTAVRSLESAVNSEGVVGPFDGRTDLFIKPGYRFRSIDGLITNFHAPRTTLIVMIAAVLGDRWRDVYRHALDDGYRFLSFGDAMYLEVER